MEQKRKDYIMKGIHRSNISRRSTMFLELRKKMSLRLLLPHPPPKESDAYFVAGRTDQISQTGVGVRFLGTTEINISRIPMGGCHVENGFIGMKLHFSESRDLAASPGKGLTRLWLQQSQKQSQCPELPIHVTARCGSAAKLITVP